MIKRKTITNNVYVDLVNNKPVSVQAQIVRNGLKRTRRFLVSKFGGIEHAVTKANDYIHYLRNEATTAQFKKAKRRPGRPLMSEFFGRRIIAN
jgi:hypothetical protein